jgi:hypothetical protein
MKRKQLLLLLALLVTAATGAWAQTTTDSNGTCGPSGEEGSVVCLYDENTLTLTISGTGPMADFTGTNMPWRSLRNNIATVTITDGVTSIGNYAFSGCPGNPARVYIKR